MHKYKILAIHFSFDMKYIYTFDEGSNIFVWKWVKDHLSESYQNLMASKKRKLAQNKGMTMERYNE